MHAKPFIAFALAVGALLPTAVTHAAPAGARMHAQRVTGPLTTVNNGSYTVTPRRDPTPVTFTLAPNARIVQTAPGTLDDVTKNDTVRADGTVSADGKSITATRLTILPAAPVGRHGRAPKSNAKHVIGTVSSTTPLQITEADGTLVTVTTSPTTHVTKTTAADSSALTVNTRVAAMLTGPDNARVAREVMILPARAGKRHKAAL